MFSAKFLSSSILAFALAVGSVLGVPILDDAAFGDPMMAGGFGGPTGFGGMGALGPMASPGGGGFVGSNNGLPPLNVPVTPLAIFPQTDVIPSTSVYPVVSVFPTMYNDYSIYGPPYVPYGAGYGGPGYGGAGYGGFEGYGLGGADIGMFGGGLGGGLGGGSWGGAMPF
ncbi:hypothetical protein DFQ26_007619 [Actinomortierella ambigua]|nr:hypothetical protein DFQ26_007619 [Actinomortierella ambigua]